jgi:NAD(P)H-flavin reductase
VGASSDGEGRFRPARLLARRSAGGGLTRVVVEPDPVAAGSYVAPGQYIEMRAGDGTGFFVLASEPGSIPWELVMRAGGGASDVVLAMPAGSAIELTSAIGDGFPMEAVRGCPLIVALVGTGVAAGPPVVGRRVREGDATLTRVVLGVRTRGELPMEDELAAWSRAGVDLTVAFSQIEPGEIAGDDRFVRGRVQDAMRARFASRAHDDAAVFVVGATSMIDAVRDVVVELGVPPHRVHTNH